MMGIQTRQSGVDGIPIARILTLVQVLQKWSPPSPRIGNVSLFRDNYTELATSFSFFYVNIDLSMSSTIL